MRSLTRGGSVDRAGRLSPLADFSAFDVKTQVVHGLPVPGAFILASTGYALVYIAALLLAATAIFARRDFK